MIQIVMNNAQPELPEPSHGTDGNAAQARMLRHEMGDFLQQVYACVAILKERLPEDWTQERAMILRLRTGAERCKNLLDAIQNGGET